MPAKTQMIHARIDPRLKKAAESVFSKIGLSTTEAISPLPYTGRTAPWLAVSCRDAE